MSIWFCCVEILPRKVIKSPLVEANTSRRQFEIDKSNEKRYASKKPRSAGAKNLPRRVYEYPRIDLALYKSLDVHTGQTSILLLKSANSPNHQNHNLQKNLLGNKKNEQKTPTKNIKKIKTLRRKSLPLYK